MGMSLSLESGGWRKQEVLSARNIRCEAFNSARWKNICQALDKLDVPAYLKNMMKSYWRNRLLVYDTKDDPRKYQITGGPAGLGVRFSSVECPV